MKKITALILVSLLGLASASSFACGCDGWGDGYRHHHYSS